MNPTSARLLTFALAAALAGCHKGEWVLVYDDVAGDTPTVDVEVAPDVDAHDDMPLELGPLPEVATEVDDAEIVAAEFPATLACSAKGTATVTVKNAGTSTWTRAAGYRLGAVDDSDPLSTEGRIDLPDEAAVAPGATWVFTIALAAPKTEGAVTSDWRMLREGVQWFGATTSHEVAVACPPPAPPKGAVTLQGNLLVDDGDPFNALGATLFWAAWGFKYDLPKLEAALQYLADNHFDYIRALGVVGDPGGQGFWAGREILWTWPDYSEVIAGVTDLAYDKYGLRMEWTLIGDGQLGIPEEADRYALVDTFVAMSQGREHKILMFEIANEYWQNGFDGEEGLAQLRALSVYLRGKTPILVAASAPLNDGIEAASLVYGGDVADVATVHFDRDVGKAEGHWRPVRQPWGWQFNEGMPVAFNNEPIGPGSSVNTEDDPLKMVSGAIVSYLSGIPAYVFHSKAGVRGDVALWDLPGAGAFQHVGDFFAPEMTGWSKQNCHWEGSPFKCFAGDADGNLVADAMWPDLDGPTSGAVRVYAVTSGSDFLAFPIGIKNKVVLEPKKAMSFDVIAPLTGEILAHKDLEAGQQFELTGGEALVLKGSTH